MHCGVAEGSGVTEGGAVDVIEGDGVAVATAIVGSKVEVGISLAVGEATTTSTSGVFARSAHPTSVNNNVAQIKRRKVFFTAIISPWRFYSATLYSKFE